VEDLRRAGANEVICTTDESIGERVQAITGGAGVPFALDAVGGATGSEGIKALGAGGRLLFYGTLSAAPITFDSRPLMVGNKVVEGFWMSEWARRQRILTMLGLFRRVGKLLRASVLTSEVAASYSLDEIKTAVERAAAPGRSGKILLKIGSR